MTPATLISRLDAAIVGYGQSVTLQRTAVDGATGGVTVAAEVTCPAKFRTFGPQDLGAGEVQDISVVISPTADLALARSYSVQYAKANGPKQALVKQWLEFLENEKR